MQYMLDTNICIYIIKERPVELVRRFRTYSPSDLCLSSITVAELECGVEKSQNRDRNRDALNLFLSPFEILPFNVDAAVRYGCVRADLERSGTPIGAMDTLIAAHALSVGAVIVTNNTKDFCRVSGLHLENWVTG